MNKFYFIDFFYRVRSAAVRVRRTSLTFLGALFFVARAQQGSRGGR